MNEILMKTVAGSLAILLCSCASPETTAVDIIAQNATAQPALIATAQADQYWRDAQATTQSSQATLEANYRNIQGTTEAATVTTQTQQTVDALTLAFTRDTATTQAMETTTTQAANSVAATSTGRALATEGAFVAASQAIQLRQAELQAQRERVFTIATYISVLVAVTIILGLIGWLFWQLIPTLVNRAGVIHYGQHGNPLLLLNQAGQTIITDPMRMLQAVTEIDSDGHASMPETTPNELQTVITGMAFHTLVEQTKHAPGHAPQLPSERIQERRFGPLMNRVTTRQPIRSQRPFQEDTAGPLPEEPQSTNLLPSTATWHRLTSYQGDGFAIGEGAQEIVALDLMNTPHMLLAGSSGTGKTRRILRPLIAQALSKGVIVVLMNESGADFSPFYNHPNAPLIRGNAATFASFLEAAMIEMERRETILRMCQVSEWSRLPSETQPEPPILIVMDEVLSLALSLSPREQKAFWALFATYASRARKLGMGSIGALTDPTYRVLGNGLTWREQCTARITFRVAKTAVSRAILDANGAEALEEGQFLAMLGTPKLVTGVAPNPTDEQLINYIGAQPIPISNRPEWLNTVLQSLRTIN